MKSFTFEAYGQKWNARIEHHAAIADGNGAFVSEVRTIFINPDIGHKEQQSTFIHELIHLIEHYWCIELGYHPDHEDLEVVELLERGLMSVMRDNKLKFP